GCGMDETTQKHIFEKFDQGDTSHAEDGNGIGLTIVGRIIVLCSGRIDIESSPGKGSTFTITLPATVPEYEDVTIYEEEA
ncbi:MAG: HAMP domain-containing histidine kinase, partial [Clostridia bacterium]|nr:HAMP domain-containing histidine kinase [Clostridia bacterium]